jgi:glycosyltransferase involved in cell wall biosynthesis
MTILRVVIDPVVAPDAGGVGRYAEELTRELIATAPRGARVDGIVSASPEADYRLIEERLPGLHALFKSALARRELQAAWQHGFTRLPGRGMVHATSLLAPLSRHERGDADAQTVVTVHDTVAWTHPETLPPRLVAWHRAMLRRAEKYADAIVVPTHAVATDLAARYDVEDRLRVIAAAPSSTLAVPADADERAARLGLPERYLLSVGAPSSRKGVEHLVRALAHDGTRGLPLVVAGGAPSATTPIDLDAAADEWSVPRERIVRLDRLDDADLAVAIARATVFVQPSLAEGFGLALLEALALGVPAVHSDVPALVEVAAGAGEVVELRELAEPGVDAAGRPEEAAGAGGEYAARIAEAVARVLDDDEHAARLRTLGRDRAGAFSWRDAAEKVWALHADL